ncbi:MAG: hypothetical protein J1F35_03485 [Erysipelotrichales bacterium]|nr:hypothetical protein [Erysipelotrichales bacterium]
MSLSYTTLNKKRIVKKRSNFDGTNTVECLDLLSRSIKWIPMTGAEIVQVPKEYVARPDLISLAIYGSDEYADIICKVNGISNPFELGEGQILVCPEENDMENMMAEPCQENVFMSDPKQDSMLSSVKNNKKKPTEKRSPNEATVFDKNYTYIEGLNGLVFY